MDASAPHEMLAMSRDIFSCHRAGATDIKWVEARNAGNHSIMHKIAPTTKKCSV